MNFASNSQAVQYYSIPNHGLSAVAVLLLFCSLYAQLATAQPLNTFNALLPFDDADGSVPQFSSLVQGTDGALYGTTPASFADRRDYSSPSATIDVGDLNHDGIPDFVSGDGLNFAVHLGNRDGTFRAGSTFNSIGNSQATFLLLADINQDGNLDVVYAGSYGVGLSYGNGDGTFRPPVLYAISPLENLATIVIADFNGDGQLDVATLGHSGIWLLFGNAGSLSSPQLLPTSQASNWGTIGTADLNADGYADLIVGTSTGFAVLLGVGDGTFGRPQQYTVPNGAFDLTFADFNRDGHTDMATSSLTSPYASIFFGRGDGTFQSVATAYLPGGLSIRAGDIDGDGNVDLVTNGVSIALGNGDGTFRAPSEYPMPAVQVVLARLWKRGGLEIFTANGVLQTSSVLLNKGHGKFIDGEHLTIGGNPQCQATADFNGDGKPDLAVANGQGLTILLGTGQVYPAYSLPGIKIDVPGGYCVATGDFNGDGFADLAVIASTQPAAGSMTVLLGLGNGTFSPSATLTFSTSPGLPVVADFNHDGNQDVALSGNLMAFGNGDGTFLAPVPFVPQPQPGAAFVDLTAGDLNGDGYPDVVLTDLSHSLAYVLLNSGNGTFGQYSFNTNTCIPTVPRLADYNGDGHVDLAILCNLGGMSVYLGNGDGTLRRGTTVAASWGVAHDLIVTDLNGDSKLDLTALADDSVFVFTGIGDGRFNAPALYGVGPNPAFLGSSILHDSLGPRGSPDLVVTDFSGLILVLPNVTEESRR